MSNLPRLSPDRAVISGRTSLLAMIEREKALQCLSDAEICRRAGMGSNTLSNLRHQPGRSLNAPSMIALVNALGFELVATPEQPQPLTGEQVDAALRVWFENTKHGWPTAMRAVLEMAE